MNIPFRWRVVLSLGVFAAAAASAQAQRVPHVGYIYPGGGQQGTTYSATIGGQLMPLMAWRPWS